MTPDGGVVREKVWGVLDCFLKPGGAAMGPIYGELASARTENRTAARAACHDRGPGPQRTQGAR